MPKKSGRLEYATDGKTFRSKKAAVSFAGWNAYCSGKTSVVFVIASNEVAAERYGGSKAVESYKKGLYVDSIHITALNTGLY